MKSVRSGTTENDSGDLWKGNDVIELQLGTDTHSYYQLAVNPAGVLVDIDRAVKAEFKWQSNSQAAVFKGKDYWTVEWKITPIGKGGVAAVINPLNGVDGLKPSKDNPWRFNLCRMRNRGDRKALSAFSPTGKNNFHVIYKFAKLMVNE
jgi:hypothetical protein